MKIADLYIRVSTDEQADKGYSQRNQEEMLQNYCRVNNIQVRKTVFEDHSAKTFNRPEWIKLLSDLSKRKGKSDLVLFSKWDRFSRNAGDAYQMISTLRRMGVEPQAVEQPLDLSVPENKMMLAFYLAAPEVENDRRALNVFHGMRRAKKEGRWMATAPIGYANKITEDGRKYIAPKEPAATILRRVFEELAKGHFAADQIRKEANKKGLKCSRSNFWNVIRNPVYCGKIQIPKFKDEDPITVNGQHEPLISESLFYEVQDILCGKNRKSRPGTKVIVPDQLPLRGFLICPNCGKMLTGSGSKGTYSVYYYYHCNSSCGCRFKAEDANERFIEELKKYAPNPAYCDLYAELLHEAYKQQTSSMSIERRQVLSQIEELTTRINTTRNKAADNQFSYEDFQIVKTECTKQITELEKQLSKLPEREKGIEGLLQKGIHNLIAIDQAYINGTIPEKRNIVSSMFPGKLIFDGTQHRTLRLNEVVSRICMLDAGFSKTKNRKTGKNLLLSGMVVLTGIEPVSKV
ncbi:recombinase family protein [Pseudobacter ginsenosidimutans]|uniref:recombinase family protein n=1 Tax=Pseudobacter ginsenosidimutans TaxID=661488 RepID=UPI00102D7021|nr:recombinase family protein [Pseudobacter ginsenosidimutans]